VKSTSASPAEFADLPPHRGHFDHLADGDLVALAQTGCTDAAEYLLYKYRNLVRAKVKSYYLVGAEREDLYQVGMIGLWQAIVDYEPEKATSFPAFAKVCIHRHIITAIKAATRQKQLPLNRSVPLDLPSDDDEPGDADLSEIMSTDASADPEELVIRREDTAQLKSFLHRMLSDFEWRVLTAYQLGRTYSEIAAALGCKPKSVDNALARIKRKVSGVPTDQLIESLQEVLS